MASMGPSAQLQRQQPPQPRFLGQTQDSPILGCPRERVFDIAWSGNGRLLASAAESNEVRLFSWGADADRPALLGTPLAHEAEVLRVAWRGSDVLASGTATGRVRLYNVRAEGEEGTGEGSEAAVAMAAEFGHKQQGQVYALKWVGPRHPQSESGSSEGSDELMTAMDDRVFFWDVARGGGPCVAAKWEFSHLPGTDSFGGDARNPDRTSYIFDAQVGCLHPGQGGSPVVCLALSDGSVRIHDRRTARAVATLRRSASAHLTALCLATEEGALVACGGRGEATVYDTRASFSVRNVLQGHARPCFGAHVVPRALAQRHFSSPSAASAPPSSSSLGAGTAAADETPGPFLLMTWSSDSTLALHDLFNPSSPSAPVAPVLVTPHPSFPIYCAAFSPPGEADAPVRLVLGGGEGHQEQHQHDHGHEHSHDEEGGGGCCGHGHHHHYHHHEEEEEEGPRTLLSYSFA